MLKVAKKLPRTGFAGIALGGLVLIACELPLILTVLGLSGLISNVSTLNPPPVVEFAGVVFMVAGVFLLVMNYFRNQINQNREQKS